MAEAAVDLLEYLSKLPVSHSALISGLRKELQLLLEELSSLKAFLRDVTEKPEDDNDVVLALRRLEAEIREIDYDVEDAIYSAAKTNNILRQLINGSRIRRKVEYLRERKMKLLLKKIRDYRSTPTGVFRDYRSTPTGVSGTRVEEPWAAPTTTLLPIGIDNVVGRKNEERAIIGQLMKQEEELKLIFLIGEGGIGKTTLARKIYVNEGVAYEFPIRIWISVTYHFNLGDVLRNILRVFTSQDIHSLSEEELTENVRSCLERKKFLLVLDDIWSPGDLGAIHNVLPTSNGGMGKVLITTCSYSVREYANDSEILKLLRLNKEDSWKVLQLKVFGCLEDCPPELKDIGEIVASLCNGLPLRIMIVGGILAGQSLTRDEWEKVRKDLEWGRRGTLPDYKAVELAYRRLSDDVRKCLLYTGLFPDDYEISAWALTHMWIAEGYVRPNLKQSLEEAATQILNDLISMNLVMADRINTIGQVKTCRIHHLVHDFCRTTAAEHKVLLRGEREREPFDIDLAERYCRHLSVHSNVTWHRLISPRDRTQVRSFLCFNESPTSLDPSYLSTVLDDFKLLKVLYYKSSKLQNLPRQITKLFRLRYVTLSVDDLNILPKSFSKLWNLQTLVIDTKSRVITMKTNIWGLICLRHLKTNAAIVMSSNKEGDGGENLQTLSNLSPESCTPDVFARARNLKTLGIRGNLAENMFLEKLEHLEKLKLMNDSCENPAPCRLPQPDGFPPNLKRLTLTKTYLLWDRHMSILTKIDNLKVLKLKEDAFTGVIWRAADSSDCFHRLEFLLIENVDIVLWEASADYLPRLRSLVLKNCENLREIPSAVAEIGLEKLEIEYLGKSAVDSARRIAQIRKQEDVEWHQHPFKLSMGAGCCHVADNQLVKVNSKKSSLDRNIYQNKGSVDQRRDMRLNRIIRGPSKIMNQSSQIVSRNEEQHTLTQ